MGRKKSGADLADVLVDERNARTALLLTMAVPFTNAQWTAAQGAQFFNALSASLTNSRADRPDGGLESFLEAVYSAPDKFPAAIVERALVEGLRGTSFREQLARQFQEASDLMEKGTTSLTQPYREWLKGHFAEVATDKEGRKSQPRTTSRLAWPKASDIIVGAEALDIDEVDLDELDEDQRREFDM